MKGERIKNFHEPSSEGWYVLQTDKGLYHLVLGGYKPVQQIPHTEILIIDAETINQRIKRVRTDDFTLYIELENGGCIVHSQSFITGDGETLFEIRYLNKNEFGKEREDWYDTDQDLIELD